MAFIFCHFFLAFYLTLYFDILFWHSICVYFDILLGILSGIYSDIFSGIHPAFFLIFYLASALTVFLAFYLAFYLTFYLASILIFCSAVYRAFILTFFLAFLLALFSGCLSDFLFWHSIWHLFCLRSGNAHWDLERLRSGSAQWDRDLELGTHWDLEFAVEVRQGPPRSGARSWGLAVPAEIWSSQLSPAVPRARSEEDGKKEGGREGSNPNLETHESKCNLYAPVVREAPSPSRYLALSLALFSVSWPSITIPSWSLSSSTITNS